MLNPLKQFFAKKKNEAKFKLGAVGPGQRLGDSTPSSSRPSGSGSASRPPEAAAPRKDPTIAQQRAAEAALARFGKTQGQDTFEKKRHQAVIRAQAQKEIEEEKKNESEAARLRDAYGPVSTSVLEGPSSLLCSGVFFHCPLLGPEVLPKEEMRQKIKEFLYAQLNEEKGLASCLIIHTMSKDKEKAKVCTDTLCKYLDNILENPSDEKFRKIRKSNKAFQERVASFEGHDTFLEAAGFESLVIDNEEFWVLSSSSGEAALDVLRTLREALVTSEPIRAELYRDTRVLLPAQARQTFDLPRAFFAISPEELKREQEAKSDYVERMGMLRTKAMRERDEQRERRKYRYALIRIRFPDELVLQGTFSVYEKVSCILEWVSGCLEHELPFVLVDAAAGGARLDEVAESPLVDVDGLVPSAILNFAWHPDLADEIARQTHMQAFLREEVRALVQHV